MIIIDFSNIFFVNMNAVYSINPGEDIDVNKIRFMILSSLGKINRTFRQKYGPLVIACDGKNSWRKEVFPFYKSHRKADRQKLTHIDWPTVFNFMADMKNELKLHTKFKVIEVEGAEGDDIIATLAIKYADQTNLIVSTDHDFLQLQSYTSVKQYHPEKEVFVTDDLPPYQYLTNHIIRGDRGDGIPNILSDDDTFVQEKKRQKKMTQKKYELFTTQEMSKWEERSRINWRRNERLIDLRNVPEHISDQILDIYINEQPASMNIFNYLSKYGQAKLLNRITDFN